MPMGAANVEAVGSVRATGRPAMLRLAMVPTLLCFALILMPPLNHDVAAVLDFSQRWLDGGRLYVDLIDVNPPLIFIVSLLPAAIAKYTPLSGTAALLLCLLAHATLLWRFSLALRAGRAEGPVEAAALDATIPLLLLLAGSDSGQREVLMAITAVPYVLLAVRRIDGPPVPRRLELAVGLAAAVAFGLKPYFLGVPVLVEGLVLLRGGPAAVLRSPAVRVMLGFWVLYAVSVPLFFPDYLRFVVPLAWEVYGDIHGAGPFRVLITELMGAAVLLLAVVAVIAFRRGSGTLTQAFGLATVGAFLSAWVQHKGWTYHVMPVTILAAGTLVAFAGRWLDAELPPRRAVALAPAFAAAAAFCIVTYAVRGGETPWRQFWWSSEPTGRLTEWLRREVHGRSILVLSPEILPVYPSVNYAEARPTLRTMSIWPLQGAYRTCPPGPAPYHSHGEMGAGESMIFNTTIEDFARRPPRAVLVTTFTNIPACGGRFDLIAYFARDPLFARIWQNYRLAGEMEGYRLYLRTW